MSEMRIWKDSDDKTIVMSCDPEEFRIIRIWEVILKLQMVIGDSVWAKINETDDGEESIVVIRDDDLRYPQLLQIFYLASNVTFRTFGWDVFHSPANKELAFVEKELSEARDEIKRLGILYDTMSGREIGTLREQRDLAILERDSNKDRAKIAIDANAVMKKMLSERKESNEKLEAEMEKIDYDRGTYTLMYEEAERMAVLDKDRIKKLERNLEKSRGMEGISKSDIDGLIAENNKLKETIINFNYFEELKELNKECSQYEHEAEIYARQIKALKLKISIFEGRSDAEELLKQQKITQYLSVCKVRLEGEIKKLKKDNIEFRSGYNPDYDELIKKYDAADVANTNKIKELELSLEIERDARVKARKNCEVVIIQREQLTKDFHQMDNDLAAERMHSATEYAKAYHQQQVDKESLFIANSRIGQLELQAKEPENITVTKLLARDDKRIEEFKVILEQLLQCQAELKERNKQCAWQMEDIEKNQATILLLQVENSRLREANQQDT